MEYTERQPDIKFGVVWVIRYLVMFTLHIWFNPVWLFVALLSYAPIAIVGALIKNNKHDQLSDLWTWVARDISKHNRAFEGWNWLLAMFAGLEAGTLYRLLTHQGYVSWWVVVICLALGLALHAHWLTQNIHG